MKNLVFLPLFLLCAMAAAQNLNLIPQPVEVRAMTGNYTLSKTTAVSYNETGAKEVAEMLAAKLSAPTGLTIKAQQG